MPFPISGDLPDPGLSLHLLRILHRQYVYTYINIGSFKFQTFKDENVRSHVQSHPIRPCVWRALSHVCVLYEWLCFRGLHCTVL